MPTEEQLNRLTGTDKTKVEFCINVLKSIQENRSLKPHMEATFNALTNNFYNDNEEEIDNSQHSFQEELSQEVNKSADKDISVDEIHNETVEKVKEEDLSELNDDDRELFDQLVN